MCFKFGYLVVVGEVVAAASAIGHADFLKENTQRRLRMDKREREREFVLFVCLFEMGEKKMEPKKMETRKRKCFFNEISKKGRSTVNGRSKTKNHIDNGRNQSRDKLELEMVVSSGAATTRPASLFCFFVFFK